MSREKLTLEITCGNTACPNPEKVVVLTGMARSNVLRRGYGYCSAECGKAGRRINVTAAMRARWKNPEARARMMVARRRAS